MADLKSLVSQFVHVLTGQCASERHRVESPDGRLLFLLLSSVLLLFIPEGLRIKQNILSNRYHIVARGGRRLLSLDVVGIGWDIAPSTRGWDLALEPSLLDQVLSFSTGCSALLPASSTSRPNNGTGGKTCPVNTAS